MSASLTAQFYRSTPRSSLFSYALRVLVTNAVGMAKEVFIFQRGAAPAPAAGEQVQDSFTSVADPVDLEEIPVNAPDLAHENPYYRLAEVTLAFRSVEDMDDTEELIKEDLNLLVRSVNSMADLTLSETVTYDGSET